MKTRFSTLDIIAILPELKAKICTGWRVNQVYDCDHKTFLFKLNKSIVQMKKDDDPVSVDEETANKMTLIIESGLRIHTTDYDWPRSPAPGGFATKLRKCIRNKRIEDIRQVGVDRLIEMKFGSGPAANYLIIELYDRGNMILTDHEYCILAILRWRRPNQTNTQTADGETTQDDSENFKVGQAYPLSRFRIEKDLEPLTELKIVELLNNSRMILSNSQNYKKRNKARQQSNSDFLDVNLKDLLNPYVIYGSNLLEDKLLKYLVEDGHNIAKRCVIQIPKGDDGRLVSSKVERYAKLIKSAIDEAEIVLNEVRGRKKSPGYIVQKQQDTNMNDSEKPGTTKSSGETQTIKTNIDFFPIKSCAERKIQIEGANLVYQDYESFDKAVDVYYCNLESQKIDTKTLVAEKEARKKLDNLKISQEKRLEDLARTQKEDEEKARLIEINSDKVENALLIIRSMLANQVPWSDIWATIQQAKAAKDPIASLITQVKFDRNEFTMRLSDPYEDSDDESNNRKKKNDNKNSHKANGKNVDIDIGMSAYANARRFFVKRRTAVIKEKKAIEVSKKAFKNVERKTKSMLKDMIVQTNITKARKRYWFENFFWFISSDGYLVVAGRDAEQNELLVKRYMKNNDIFVHGDLHGSSTVIIKNELSIPIPPKTLTEAGAMAVCYSSAWDSKIATTSYWVYPSQVSKTAPAGEYLTLGSFMIRGKKNYLPLSNLVLGFGFLFRLDEESIERRKEIRLAREANASIADDCSTSNADKVEGSDSEGDDQIQDYENSGTDDSSSDEKPEVEVNSMETIKEDNRTPEVEEVDEDDDIELDNKITEHRLIDTLSENPLTEDILLYAIPMCGPYSALSNYKYKVKVIPGANKRGKAAKACLGMFLHDKRASTREKDLLRAMKDQDFARNIPNKVKISSANLKTLTKKKPKKSEVRLPR